MFFQARIKCLVAGNMSFVSQPLITTALTNWDRMTHICVGNLAIMGSDNGLSPGRRQAIIWTNAGILLIGSLWTNFSAIWIGIQTFSLKKIHLKMSSAKWRLFCLGLNVLNHLPPDFSESVVTCSISLEYAIGFFLCHVSSLSYHFPDSRDVTANDR